jgi:hypothetical protein
MDKAFGPEKKDLSFSLEVTGIVIPSRREESFPDTFYLSSNG